MLCHCSEMRNLMVVRAMIFSVGGVGADLLRDNNGRDTLYGGLSLDSLIRGAQSNRFLSNHQLQQNGNKN